MCLCYKNQLLMKHCVESGLVHIAASDDWSKLSVTVIDKCGLPGEKNQHLKILSH